MLKFINSSGLYFFQVRLEEIYLSILTTTIPGSRINLVYNVLKNRRITKNIGKKRRRPRFTKKKKTNRKDLQNPQQKLYPISVGSLYSLKSHLKYKIDNMIVEEEYLLRLIVLLGFDCVMERDASRIEFFLSCMVLLLTNFLHSASTELSTCYSDS